MCYFRTTDLWSWSIVPAGTVWVTSAVDPSCECQWMWASHTWCRSSSGRCFCCWVFGCWAPARWSLRCPASLTPPPWTHASLEKVRRTRSQSGRNEGVFRRYFVGDQKMRGEIRLCTLLSVSSIQSIFSRSLIGYEPQQPTYHSWTLMQLRLWRSFWLMSECREHWHQVAPPPASPQ